jgi:hypothetical protein
MSRQTGHRTRRAIVATETVLGLALMMLMAGLVTQAVVSYRRTSGAYYWRQAAGWAAEAQLQRYEAGAPLDSLPPPGMIPEDITLHTRHEPGRGSWEGFERVTVTATAALPAGKSVREEFTAYVPARGQ